MQRVLGPIVRHWQALYFGVAILAVVFAAGVAVGVYRVFPYQVLSAAVDSLQDWRENYRLYLRLKPELHVHRARQRGDGVVTNEVQAYPGVTFLTGLWGDSLGMTLVDGQGRVAHRWRVAFNEIWGPDAPHLDAPIHDWETHIHGAYLYPNGDVVFNFEYYGLVKIDRCSKVIWKLARKTHHSIDVDQQGNLWVPARVMRTKPLERLPNMPVPLIEEYILQVSPEGEVLREISLYDAFYDSGLESILFAHGHDKVRPARPNILHLNDIEVLEAPEAQAFDLFAPGDLMVSLRNLNLIAVLDPQTAVIKWWNIGPYIRQHDPDFLGNGRIAIFDNRKDDAEGEIFEYSQILELDPGTREVSVAYQGSDEAPFFTNTMGKQQYLPNGNILIAEPSAGRAFETTPDGKIVWEFINRWDDDEVALIEEATRYPESYSSFTGEVCNQ